MHPHAERTCLVDHVLHQGEPPIGQSAGRTLPSQTTQPVRRDRVLHHTQRRKIVLPEQHSYPSYQVWCHLQQRMHSHVAPRVLARKVLNECAHVACRVSHLGRLGNRKLPRRNETLISCCQLGEAPLDSCEAEQKCTPMIGNAILAPLCCCQVRRYSEGNGVLLGISG